MGKHEPSAIRNLALVGGPGTGKTSLSEALLAAAGTIPRAGSVKDGSALSDHDPEEKERQHSIGLGLLHADHAGTRFHILDAPGYPDFVGEAAAALAASELAVLCVKAGERVSFPAHRVWDMATRQGRARCVVVTHLDHVEVDWDGLCAELSESLSARCLPLVVPKGTGAAFAGVAAVPLGGAAEGDLAARRDTLVEAVVEVDEEAMTAFLEDTLQANEATVADLLTRSMVEGSVVPVLGVSAIDGRGVPELLAFLARCGPSPLQGPFYATADDQPIDPAGPGAAALVFKAVVDPFVGKLCVLRVVRGELNDGQVLRLARTGKEERLTHLQAMQGKEHKPTETAVAGDIVAVGKMENLETSDTLCDPAHPVTIRPVELPPSPVARAIEPVDHGDEVKLSTALRRIHTEDPTFVYAREAATGELVVHGVTLMHVETMLRRVKDRHKVDVKVMVPRVPLKETCTAPAEGHHRHKKQTGGRGQFGEVYLKIEPGKRGSGLQFLNETVGGSIPKQFIPAIEKGVHGAVAEGVIAGYPVEDVIVKVTDGKFHAVDSDEASFKLAGARAFRDAFQKSKPVLLEPIMEMEVAVPSRFMGAITSDLTGRRGHISGMESLGDTQVIKAHAPQREILTYPTALHSMTQGEGSFLARFHDYAIVPGNVQQEVMAEFKPKSDED